MDPRRPVDELQVIATELKDLQRQIDRLTAPSGTSAFQSVAKLTQLITNLQAQVDAALAGKYTNAQIDARIASTPGAVTVNGDHQVAGNEVINGSLVAAGLATLNAGIRSTDAYSYVTPAGRRQLWIGPDGSIGVSS